jgi:NitT/TauT family transport system ATP-binding protein
LAHLVTRRATTMSRKDETVPHSGASRRALSLDGDATTHQRAESPNATNPLKLEVADVAIGYYSERHGSFFEAMHSLSFTVPDHQMVALIGPSGCGKSTFLRAVSGLLPYQRGRLLVDGSLVTGPRPDTAFVFQNPALLPWRTVERNVSYGLEVRGLGKAEIRERVDAMLELVGLSEFKGSYPHQLSGGMQQRANLARALVVQPVLLLMDEPFSALDPQSRERLGDELMRVREVTDQTILMVTHQVDEAVALADRVVVLTRGPGSVLAGVVDIPLGRNRRVEATRHDPRYGPLVRGLRDLLSGVACDEAPDGDSERSSTVKG